MNANGSINVLNGNVVSGNDSNGVVVYGSNNLVEGNIVGPDVKGKVALGNDMDGVVVQGGSNNTIGGTVPGAGNLISGTDYGQGVAIVNVVTPTPTTYSQSAGTSQLSLSTDAYNADFSLSTSITGFTPDTIVGPIGIVFPSTGGMLVADESGTLRLFNSDANGQTISAATQVGSSFGKGNTEGLATLGSAVYMAEATQGEVVQVNANGTTQLIVSIPSAVGIAADPRTGLLYVADEATGEIYKVNPTAKTDTVLLNLNQVVKGLDVDTATNTLYVAEVNYGVVGYDLSTGNQVFDWGPSRATPTASPWGRATSRAISSSIRTAARSFNSIWKLRGRR